MAKQQIDRPVIFAAALLVAIGGLIYELLLGTASSYLFGDSITSFSLSIGTMLFGMGIGSLISGRFLQHATFNFVLAELLLSVIGGGAVLTLFAAFAFTKVYWLVFIVLSILIGILIGLEIPLMVRIAKRSKGNIEQVLSRVLALDYIGALIASILFPFLLLPYLGLIRTSFVMALLNVTLAFYIFRRTHTARQRPLLRALIIGVMIMFSAGLVFANVIDRQIQGAQYRDPLVFYKTSAYQRIAITNYRNDTRLYLNDQLQFSSVDEARYHETLTHAAMTSTPRIKQVLILGGGDGMVAREVLKYKGVQAITLVDLDPSMTDVARSNRLLSELNQHALDDSRVTVRNQDAHTYLRNTSQQYDVIITDLVDPSNERVAKLYSDDYYQAAHRRLTPTGVFITQATSSYFTPNAHQLIVQTMRSVADTRQITPLAINVPSFGEWSFALSTPSGERLFSAQPLPKNMSYISTKLLNQATQFPPDFKPTIDPNMISTLLGPKIYTVYQNDMRQWRYDN